jgi:hypothetical protein
MRQIAWTEDFARRGNIPFWRGSIVPARVSSGHIWVTVEYHFPDVRSARSAVMFFYTERRI